MKTVIEKLKKNLKERKDLVEEFDCYKFMNDELDEFVKSSEYILNSSFLDILSEYYETIITNKTTKIIELGDNISLHPSGIYRSSRKLSFETLLFIYPEILDINKEGALKNNPKFTRKLGSKMNDLFRILSFINTNKDVLNTYSYILKKPFIIKMDVDTNSLYKISICNDGGTYNGCIIRYDFDYDKLFNIFLEERRDEIISGFKKGLEKRILLQKKVLEMFEKYFGKEVVIASL